MPRASPSMHHAPKRESNPPPAHYGHRCVPRLSLGYRVALSALARLLLSRLVPVLSTGLAAYAKRRSFMPSALLSGRVFGWDHIWFQTSLRCCPQGAQFPHCRLPHAVLPAGRGASTRFALLRGARGRIHGPPRVTLTRRFLSSSPAKSLGPRQPVPRSR